MSKNVSSLIMAQNQLSLFDNIMQSPQLVPPCQNSLNKCDSSLDSSSTIQAQQKTVEIPCSISSVEPSSLLFNSYSGTSSVPLVSSERTTPTFITPETSSVSQVAADYIPNPRNDNCTEMPYAVPASFENMATNPVYSQVKYHPVIHHWFYCSEKAQIWYPFSFTDSLALEDSFQKGGPEIVATDDGRYDVQLSEKIRKSVYWEEEPSLIRRCSWFRKGPFDQLPIPYNEDTADLLETEYAKCMTSGEWHAQIELGSAGRVIFNSHISMVHYSLQDTTEDFPTGISVTSSQTPYTVKRGTDDFEIPSGEFLPIDNLLFLVHGIGSVCDLSFRGLEECVGDFRHLAQQLSSVHFKQSLDSRKIGRIEILPISWHKALHGDATGIDKNLKKITLRSIPKLRDFTNDTLLDILFYTSPVYCQHIIDTVASELNRLLEVFKKRNPTFAGSVSLGGHSLGSVILFDLLMHQPSEDNSLKSGSDKSMSTSSDAVPGEILTSSVDYEMGSAGTGQLSVIYPRLNFKPDAFFLLGSPVAMFITIRGIDALGENFKLPTCDRVYNIFHPYDPVAYRLENLIAPNLTELRPVLVPHHKGRKRMHLELKDTLERVGTDLKHRIFDSFSATWNKVYRLYAGNDDDELEQNINKEFSKQFNDNTQEISVEQDTVQDEQIIIGQLNGGRRIDYVLQEKPYESFTEYIFALQAHVTYWSSEDTVLMILKELYKIKGIIADAENTNIDSLVSSPHQYLSPVSEVPCPMVPVTQKITPALNDSLLLSSNLPVNSTESKLQQESLVPLLSSSSINLPEGLVPPLHGSLNTSPQAFAAQVPRFLSGRPMQEGLNTYLGMDPTAAPSVSSVMGPPPVPPKGTTFSMRAYKKK